MKKTLNLVFPIWLSYESLLFQTLFKIFPSYPGVEIHNGEPDK